ncbi:unnamed protein product [Rotaria sp. Silwood1]|nr:unnamed protein product [Rotaria sp. Silwood1]CAF3474214.1 unnamed protein product [Rotaria sp. Silwood1]CAF4952256.1 unnamed protein product [Rotaria sp. Silwood1]
MVRPTQEFLVYRGGKWIPQLVHDLSDHITFAEIKYNYANIVDYIRIIMCVIAGFTIITEWHLLTALLILGSILLDWIDGPIARAFNQCCIFGSGIDWLADILGEVVMMAWWIRYDYTVIPWLLIATSIEIGTGIFDFSITSTARYPKLKKGQNGFFLILEWTMPENQYTHFGTFLWLAYPFYCVFRTLEYCYGYYEVINTAHLYTLLEESNFVLTFFLLNRYLLFVPAVLYIWCEAAYGAHIIGSWIEASRKVKPSADEIVYDDVTTSAMGGFIHYGTLSTAHQKLLQDIYIDLQSKFHTEYKSTVSQRKVFWINIWKRSGKKTGLMVEFDQSDQLDELVHSWIAKYYDINEILLDGYGYILNPASSQAQVFHLDYTIDYSTIFVPLTEISHNNAVQYIIPSPSTSSTILSEATQNPDCVDVKRLLKDGDYYSVRQCVAKPFTLFKMDFGTIHRAISNQESYDRLMFYVSVIKKSAIDTVEIPDEPLFQSIDKI